MGFEPMTLLDLVGCSNSEKKGCGFKSHLELGFFSESTFLLTFYNIIVVVSSLTYSLRRLVGCILICFNVTARCC